MSRITANDLKHLGKIIKIYKKAYRNWFGVLINLAVKGEAKAITRDGRIIEGDRRIIGWLARLYELMHDTRCCGLIEISGDLSYITIEIEGRRARLYEFQVMDLSSCINDYQVLNVKGRSVLDIGAFVGDTAIYFYLRGASKVVSVEPSPWAFQVAKRNVEANRMDNIILINCAVDKEDGKKLSLSQIETGIFFKERVLNNIGDVEIITCSLDSLIERFGPFDVLKMDCEGCEYYSIPHSKKLGEFEEILLEYHNGYDILARKLRSEGFRLKFSKIGTGKKYYDYPVDEKQGYIYAVKL